MEGEETNIVPAAASGTPAPYDPEHWNPWDDDTDRILTDKIPLLRISYPNAKGVPDGAPTGVFYNSITGELFDAVRVLLLQIVSPKQVLWPEAYSQDNRAVCMSENGWHPTGGTNPFEGPCRVAVKGRAVERCQMLQWTRSNGGKSAPPRCRTTVSSLIWILRGFYKGGIVDVNAPVLLPTHSKANEELAKLKSTLKTLKLRYKPVEGIPINFLIPIDVSLRTEQAPRGKYWIPQWKVLTEADRVDTAFARDVMEATEGLAELAKRVTVDSISGAEEVGSDTPF